MTQQELQAQSALVSDAAETLDMLGQVELERAAGGSLSLATFTALVSEDLAAHPEARSTPEVFTLARIAEFCAARDTDRRVEVSEDLWFYFLEVLPPVHMGYWARRSNGPGAGWTEFKASFGFAEGAELVTAFWREDGRYFAQLTNERNRG